MKMTLRPHTREQAHLTKEDKDTLKEDVPQPGISGRLKPDGFEPDMVKSVNEQPTNGMKNYCEAGCFCK